eukprot:1159938-Pelagomonas_calceolata.AAC.15
MRPGWERASRAQVQHWVVKAALIYTRGKTLLVAQRWSVHFRHARNKGGGEETSAHLAVINQSAE